MFWCQRSLTITARTTWEKMLVIKNAMQRISHDHQDKSRLGKNVSDKVCELHCRMQCLIGENGTMVRYGGNMFPITRQRNCLLACMIASNKIRIYAFENIAAAQIRIHKFKRPFASTSTAILAGLPLPSSCRYWARKTNRKMIIIHRKSVTMFFVFAIQKHW